MASTGRDSGDARLRAATGRRMQPPKPGPPAADRSCPTSGATALPCTAAGTAPDRRCCRSGATCTVRAGATSRADRMPSRPLPPISGCCSMHSPSERRPAGFLAGRSGGAGDGADPAGAGARAGPAPRGADRGATDVSASRAGAEKAPSRRAHGRTVHRDRGFAPTARRSTPASRSTARHSISSLPVLLQRRRRRPATRAARCHRKHRSGRPRSASRAPARRACRVPRLAHPAALVRRPSRCAPSRDASPAR